MSWLWPERMRRLAGSEQRAGQSRGPQGGAVLPELGVCRSACHRLLQAAWRGPARDEVPSLPAAVEIPPLPPARGFSALHGEHRIGVTQSPWARFRSLKEANADVGGEQLPKTRCSR